MKVVGHTIHSVDLKGHSICNRRPFKGPCMGIWYLYTN